MFSLHLSGKNLINETTLLGKSVFQLQQSISHSDLILKTEIYNNFLFPLLSKQWQTLYENLFFVPKFKKKIQGKSSFEAYDTFLSFLDVLAEEHKELESMEKKLQMLSKASNNQVLSMIYKTKKIKLLPQYEIYDMILGKPLREKGEIYDKDKLSLIVSLLQKDSITFPEIREKLTTL